MMKETQKELAIVTGGSKGIGRAITFKLLEEGYAVAILARTESHLRALSEESDDIFPYRVDLSVEEDLKTVGKRILSKLGAPSILVNNAGVFFSGNILEEEEGKLENMIKTNLYSAYHLTRLCIDKMSEKTRGHIFNICSVASLDAYPAGGSYSISKYALAGFSKNLRLELREKGIKVTSIFPGATWSDSWAGVDLPKDRLMNPEDVAEMLACCLRLSPQAVVEEIVMRPQLGDL